MSFQMIVNHVRDTMSKIDGVEWQFGIGGIIHWINREVGEWQHLHFD